MTKKIHKTHFPITKDAPWKRPVTISCIAGMGWRCGVEGCEREADYMGDGRTWCTFHWTKEK